MHVLKIVVSVTVDGADQDVFDVVDTGLVVNIFLEVLLSVWVVGVLNDAAVCGDATHAEGAWDGDLFHFAEIPKPNRYLMLIQIINILSFIVPLLVII